MVPPSPTGGLSVKISLRLSKYMNKQNCGHKQTLCYSRGLYWDLIFQGLYSALTVIKDYVPQTLRSLELSTGVTCSIRLLPKHPKPVADVFISFNLFLFITMLNCNVRTHYCSKLLHLKSETRMVVNIRISNKDNP